MGHELHHYYRNRTERALRPFGDDNLAWTISTTETEGVAGLIDKAAVPTMTREELVARIPAGSRRDYFESYQHDYRRSNQ